MTLAEILAKVTGLEGKITALETDKATTATALAAETTARLATETKLAEVTAELGKIKAAAPPPPANKGEPDENPHADAIAALEKAITVLKATSPAPEEDDKDSKEDAKAEDGADTADDAEAKECMARKDFPKVLAIRQKQLDRKQARVPVFAKKIQANFMKKSIVAEAAKLGIPLPLAMRKPNENPLRAEKSSRGRAHKLTASGFNSDPTVAALNTALGRAVRN